MYWFEDVHERRIRLTDERWEHIESDHPEMFGQLEKISETVLSPDCIIMSKTDDEVELFREVRCYGRRNKGLVS
jgi:hypothetical protein